MLILVLNSSSPQSHSSCLTSCKLYTQPAINIPTFRSYYTDKVVCGSDGIVYKNRCHFSNARCLDDQLKYLSKDICEGNDNLNNYFQ